MKVSAYSILFAIAAAICLMSTSTNADNTNSAFASEETKYVRGRAGEVNRNRSDLVNQQATEEINANPARREESVRRFLQTGRHDAPAKSPKGANPPTTKTKMIKGNAPAPVPSSSVVPVPVPVPVPVTSVTGGPSPALVTSAPVASAPETDSPTSCWATNTACIQYVDCDMCCEGYGYNIDVFRTTCGVFPTATPQEVQQMCVTQSVPPGEDPNPDFTGPGFKIKNDTPYHVEISLWQVGPLYWELVAPGQYFFQETGAVWFTVKAAIKLDQEGDIDVWDAVWPIASIVTGVLLAIVTAGSASGPVAASVAAGGAASTATATVTTAVASSLIGAGLPAGSALYVAAAGLGALKFALSTGGMLVVEEATQTSLERVLTADVMTLARTDMYAGPAFPLQKPLIMRIHDGLMMENTLTAEGTCIASLNGGNTLKLEIPCLPDSILCLAGTTCNDCCNGSAFWEQKATTACGPEPCWQDGWTCGPGTTCNKCCNTARDDLGWKCGGVAWPDGTVCGIGTTCDFCANGSTFWAGKLITACGTEPCWGNDEVCGSGTTCNQCCDGADCPWYQFGVCNCNSN